MSDTDSAIQRKSAALGLLKRRTENEEEAESDTGSTVGFNGQGLASSSSLATSQAAISAVHQHGSMPSMSNRLTAHGALDRLSKTPSPKSTKLVDKSASLESSIRKFRIVEALRSGDTAAVSKAIREAVENGPRASTTSISTITGALDDTTILHLAIQCAEQPVVEHVLSAGAASIDINARDKDGNTPLHIAAMQGRSQVVRMLLEHKDINDAIANSQGRLPIDYARNPDIFQQLQLSRSVFAESKIKQVQDLIARNDFSTLEQVLEEPRFKTVLDINSPEFALDPLTCQAGGTLLHEAARRKDAKLIQVLLLHGADPFRRDRKGKLAQEVTKDDVTKAMLKKSPAAVAAQRGIQEKAVLGSVTPGLAAGPASDPLAGREAREMKGYLKKWTNYRKGYQLRWFVLEDGVLSYYKHQDDSGSACRGAINMRIAKLLMSPEEKTKFEIIGKSSVKYTLKANHEVEAKRWFWALNNSIQWTKDQAKEEERQRVRKAELLKQAKVDFAPESQNESTSPAEGSKMPAHTRAASKAPTLAETSYAGSGEDEELVDVADGKADGNGGAIDDAEYDYEDGSSVLEAPDTPKDAFNITAQSARLQLETMAHVNAAMLSEAAKSPMLTISDAKVAQALATYDAGLRSLAGLVGDLLRISRDREKYWRYRLDRESKMRRMWEESMAQVAREHEALEARVGQSELKRRMTKKALKEAMHGRIDEGGDAADTTRDVADISISDSESEGEEEFFDAVDAGEVEVAEMPRSEANGSQEQQQQQQQVVSDDHDIRSSFQGYENGFRTRLKLDADNRPKISLWGILKSMIGKDLSKMTVPVSFNEPTSLLFRCAEDMEYADLLDLAAERTDSIERLVYVAAFAASVYASTIGRIAKPFNPLLGETFEYARPDKNYRLFIEQVSHHPPVGAAWAESPRWTYHGESAVKSKFRGPSFDVYPLGTWFLRLRPTGAQEELYTWKKVSTSVTGIITGSPVLDHYGPMEVKNWTTGEVCKLEFKPRGWKASSAFHLTGKVLDANGRVRISMGGCWNSKLYARLTPGYEADVEEPKASDAEQDSRDGKDEPSPSSLVHRGSMSDPSRAYLVWKANPRPEGIPFNLTPFAITFNSLDDTLRPWIAPTDSRLRPDQRAMEDGEYDRAAEEKARLEEAQRARRRQRESRGHDFAPAWFVRDRCDVTGEEYWRFTGDYWKRRALGGPHGQKDVWHGLEPIYQDVGGGGS